MLNYFYYIKQLQSIRSSHVAGDVGQMSCSFCEWSLNQGGINIFGRPDIYFIMIIVIV